MISREESIAMSQIAGRQAMLDLRTSEKSWDDLYAYNLAALAYNKGLEDAAGVCSNAPGWHEEISMDILQLKQ